MVLFSLLAHILLHLNPLKFISIFHPKWLKPLEIYIRNTRTNMTNIQGINYEELQHLLNYMYDGEVSVPETSLGRILEVSRELCLSGLNTEGEQGAAAAPRPAAGPSTRGKTSTPVRTIKTEAADEGEVKRSSSRPGILAPVRRQQPPPVPASSSSTSSSSQHNRQPDDGAEFLVGNDDAAADQAADAKNVFEQYLIRVKHEGKAGYRCKLCDKAVVTRKTDMTYHIESIHFPGTFSYSCNYCDAVLDGRNKMRKHIARHHPYS